MKTSRVMRLRRGTRTIWGFVDIWTKIHKVDQHTAICLLYIFDGRLLFFNDQKHETFWILRVTATYRLRVRTIRDIGFSTEISKSVWSYRRTKRKCTDDITLCLLIRRFTRNLKSTRLLWSIWLNTDLCFSTTVSLFDSFDFLDNYLVPRKDYDMKSNLFK